MTTATASMFGALGFSGLRRGNSVVLENNATFLGLASRLRNEYATPATFGAYENSLNDLADRVMDALANGSSLSDSAKIRLAATIVPAHDFLINRPHNVKPPEIEIWDSGKVGFEWYVRPNRILNATIDENRKLVFSAIVGQERTAATRTIDSQWPRELVALVEKLR